MKKIVSIIIIISSIFMFVACSKTYQSTGIAYLYGEKHGAPMILKKEFNLWYDYYHKNGMRHLFLELPYYAAKYLNLWINSENNAILDEIFEDIKGTAMDTPETKELFINIKKECPETIFHGVDVGHAYQSMGNRYLNYLSENNLQDTEEFNLAKENIEQGKKFYDKKDNAYREKMLVENFKREFDKLNNQNIMGIFGESHTKLDNSSSNDNMIALLTDYYGKDHIISESLAYLVNSPIKTDKIVINKKEYEAEYFGRVNLSLINKDFSHREFWRLKDAFKDFSTNKTNGNILPLYNYPMELELNQIYIVDYTKADGSVIREVHRYDGTLWKGQEVTQQIMISN